MARVLCAYETNIPGAAAEKLRQREGLESMLNQLEDESLNKAADEMPPCHDHLANSMQSLRAWRNLHHVDDADSNDITEALQDATRKIPSLDPERPQART